MADLLAPGVADLKAPGAHDLLAPEVADLLAPGVHDLLAPEVADLLAPGVHDLLAYKTVNSLSCLVGQFSQFYCQSTSETGVRVQSPQRGPGG